MGMTFSEKGSSFNWIPTSQKTTGDFRLDNPSFHELVRSSIESGFIANEYKHQWEGIPDL
jgi:hypothetical protein